MVFWWCETNLTSIEKRVGNFSLKNREIEILMNSLRFVQVLGFVEVLIIRKACYVVPLRERKRLAAVPNRAGDSCICKIQQNHLEIIFSVQVTAPVHRKRREGGLHAFLVNVVINKKKIYEYFFPLVFFYDAWLFSRGECPIDQVRKMSSTSL